MSQTTPFSMEVFKGVNRKSTETLLEAGEASLMSNYFVTDDLKLQKMFGYAHLFSSLGDHRINGIWYGYISGTAHLIFACNGHIYEHSLSAGTNTDLGTVDDAFPTLFWVTNNTVYIQDGDDFYSWGGSGSIAAVAGYAPTVATASPPAGGGTLLESMNYITGQKIQKFSGDGLTTVFQLLEYDIDAVDAVVVNGVTLTEGTDYTVNLPNGTVIFVSAPSDNPNNTIITWTKVTAGNRALITNCRYYGGVYYSRFWLFGNSDHKNTRYVSGITMAGVSDPTYWPLYADSNVGEYEITGICTQYDKQIIHTAGNESEASAWYSYEETYTDSSTGLLVTIFPVKPINSKVGNVAKGQIQIIYNNPFTLWKGVYEWASTSVVNEKNVGWISERIQNDLDDVDLTTAITVDWSDKGQYWLVVGNRAWVLNYRVGWYDAQGNRVKGAWYVLDLAHKPTCFAIVESQLYFGTDDGTIMKFDETLKTYDGETIDAVWRMAYYNFGSDWIEKFINRIFISLLPRIKTHVDITYKTDRNGTSDTYTAAYALSTFDHLNFAAFSFATNYGPQPFKFKIKAKKFDYFLIELRNNSTDTVTVLSITLPIRAGGEVRRR